MVAVPAGSVACPVLHWPLLPRLCPSWEPASAPGCGVGSCSPPSPPLAAPSLHLTGHIPPVPTWVLGWGAPEPSIDLSPTLAWSPAAFPPSPCCHRCVGAGDALQLTGLARVGPAPSTPSLPPIPLDGCSVCLFVCLFVQQPSVLTFVQRHLSRLRLEMSRSRLAARSFRRGFHQGMYCGSQPLLVRALCWSPWSWHTDRWPTCWPVQLIPFLLIPACSLNRLQCFLLLDRKYVPSNPVSYWYLQ